MKTSDSKMGSETVKGTNAIDELETVNIFVNARE